MEGGVSVIDLGPYECMMVVVPGSSGRDRYWEGPRCDVGGADGDVVGPDKGGATTSASVGDSLS